MDKGNALLSSGSIRMVRFKRILLLTIAVCWVLQPSDAKDIDENQKDESGNRVISSDEDHTLKKKTTHEKKEQGDEDPKKRKTLENHEERDKRPTESSSEVTDKKKNRQEGRREHGRKSKEGKTKDKSKDKEKNNERGRPQDFGANVARGKYLYKRSAKKVLQLPLTHPKSFLKNRAAPGVRPAAAMASANFVRRFVDSPLSHQPEAKLYRHRMEKGKMENNDIL